MAIAFKWILGQLLLYTYNDAFQRRFGAIVGSYERLVLSAMLNDRRSSGYNRSRRYAVYIIHTSQAPALF